MPSFSSPDDDKKFRSNFHGSFSSEEEGRPSSSDPDDHQIPENSDPNSNFSSSITKTSNENDDDDDRWLKKNTSNKKMNIKKKKKKKKQVFLEGFVENPDEDELGRTKSLTDDDLEELKGCLDLGFGFSYDEIPELCNTLPALELCYSLTQKYLDEQHQPHKASSSPVESLSDNNSSPIANWKISSPGDDPEDVKARLKYWAQAVACTVRLCS
ncbi:OLC1v1018643C1 [Oldenlandia corymbosa var. corymbosa]|uniref:OLC1v1018643C1 n=1 Tax=Oldenlandia corymbosa var. corymbosa TaxID=529605 RepID=A0AAV1EC26_OLDCO|nr:OLC1v1018643C1 [Oldenlandia corymbosa var. corymbosa]